MKPPILLLIIKLFFLLNLSVPCSASSFHQFFSSYSSLAGTKKKALEIRFQSEGIVTVNGQYFGLCIANH